MKSGRREPSTTIAEVTAVYDTLGSAHDWLSALFLTSGGKREKAVRFIGLNPGDRVIEVGSGTGVNFPPLWRRIAPTGGIIALDISVTMQDAARRGYGRSGMQIEFATEDAARYRAQRPVDCVYFGQSFNTLPHHRLVVENMWDQLRPGGRLAVFDSSFFGPGADLMRHLCAGLVRATLGADVWVKPWEAVSTFLRERGIDAELHWKRLGLFHYVFYVIKPPTGA